MAKLSYWQRRLLQITIDRDKKDQAYIQEMHKRYDDLSSAIYKDIQQWVKRYAINDDMSDDAAYELLSKDEQRNWSMTLKQFREKAIAGGYDQELNREYFKSRITRLEQLESQLYLELVEMANAEAASMGNHLSGQLNESYLRSVYEITDRGSFSVPFDHYSSTALQIAISKPWKGGNFSSRVWGNHTKYLPDKLSKVMAQAKVSGWGVDRMTNEMMYGVDKTLRNRMITLVQTESAHLSEVATDKAMEKTGVEEWEWLATLEIHTCEICGRLDGQTFAIDDKTAPIVPAHPNCRCTKVPVIPGWRSSKRWQRDPITGKGSIGENITFDQWKKSLDESYFKAKDMLEVAKKNEPDITNDLKNLTKKSGFKLEGLEYRLKTLESLARKVKNEPDAKMRDVTRYTVIGKADTMTKDYNGFVAKMLEKGYNVSAVKNYWNNHSNPYNGINNNFISPKGYEFELQFHTQESFDLKNGKLHELYERQRVLDPFKDVDEILKLDFEMNQLSKKLTRPKNIELIGGGN